MGRAADFRALGCTGAFGDHPGNIRFLEASNGASIHRCQLSYVRFLKTSDAWGEHPPLPPGNVRFLEASDGASIHRCDHGNVRFLEASDRARFLEASDGAEHPQLPTIAKEFLRCFLLSFRGLLACVFVYIINCICISFTFR